MATPVMVEVKSLQKQDEQQNIYDYKTRGYLYQKGQATYLQYAEGMEGLEGVQTTLKLEKDRVTLIRHGNLSMRQEFATDLSSEGLYQTPYGDLMIGTVTSLLEMAIGFEEGRIRIQYELSFEGDTTSQNTLEIMYQSITEEEH